VAGKIEMKSIETVKLHL